MHQPVGKQPKNSPQNAHYELTIVEAQAGRTVSEIVRSALPEGTSWNRARELCKRGKVWRNAVLATDAAERVQLGDVIRIDLHAPRRSEHVLDDAAALHVDADIIVVDKPAGVMSVPFESGDKDTLVDRVRALLRRQGGTRAELGVVQRLDKDTSGVMVFTRTLAAKRYMQGLFRRHAIERRYLALAHGQLPAQRVESDLIHDRGDGLRGSFGLFRRARGPLPRTAQHAITELRPLEALSGATLVECQLHTGRQHQIRIHLSERGHPLLGERVYVRDYKQPLLEAPRPMLHARLLAFCHPRTGREIGFEVEPPADFAAVLARLRGDA